MTGDTISSRIGSMRSMCSNTTSSHKLALTWTRVGILKYLSEDVSVMNYNIFCLLLRVDYREEK